jgi:WXG100 family type VII secretion target
MADETRGDYQQLEQVAQRFSQQADAIQEMMQNTKNAFEVLAGGDWIGEGSDAFQSEMEGEVFPAVQRLQEALTTGSEVTNTIAQTLQQADEEASSIFRSWRA